MVDITRPGFAWARMLAAFPLSVVNPRSSKSKFIQHSSAWLGITLSCSSGSDIPAKVCVRHYRCKGVGWSNRVNLIERMNTVETGFQGALPSTATPPIDDNTPPTVRSRRTLQLQCLLQGFGCAMHPPQYGIYLSHKQVKVLTSCHTLAFPCAAITLVISLPADIFNSIKAPS